MARSYKEGSPCGGLVSEGLKWPDSTRKEALVVAWLVRDRSGQILLGRKLGGGHLRNTH